MMGHHADLAKVVASALVNHPQGRASSGVVDNSVKHKVLHRTSGFCKYFGLHLNTKMSESRSKKAGSSTRKARGSFWSLLVLVELVELKPIL